MLLSAVMHYRFLQLALGAGVLTSIVCGIIGVIIVEKKLVMLSGGIAHASYGGVGLGYLLGFEPILGALGFAAVSAVSIGALRKRAGSSAETITAILWSVGMALGIVFIALMPGYPPDITSYLFGNILSVKASDLYMEAAVFVAVLLIVGVFFNDWKSFLFDDEFAGILGMKTSLMEYVLLIMTALVVVVLIRVVGIVLILALLTAPAATAAMICKKLSGRMIISSVLGIIYCCAGLWLSYDFNIPSGATVIIISALGYIGVYLLKKIKSSKA